MTDMNDRRNINTKGELEGVQHGGNHRPNATFAQVIAFLNFFFGSSHSSKTQVNTTVYMKHDGSEKFMFLLWILNPRAWSLTSILAVGDNTIVYCCKGFRKRKWRSARRRSISQVMRAAKLVALVLLGGVLFAFTLLHDVTVSKLFFRNKLNRPRTRKF